MEIEQESKLFSLFFRIGMLWRVVYGTLKFILGAALLTIATLNPAGLFYQLMRHEIIEDPGDVFLRFASPIVDHISVSTTAFVGLYLLFWGFVDVFLSVNILRGKLWAFSVALILVSLFVLYEIYRVTYTHSLVLEVIIVVDVFIIWLIGKENRILRKKKAQYV